MTETNTQLPDRLLADEGFSPGLEDAIGVELKSIGVFTPELAAAVAARLEDADLYIEIAGEDLSEVRHYDWRTDLPGGDILSPGGEDLLFDARVAEDEDANANAPEEKSMWSGFKREGSPQDREEDSLTSQSQLMSEEDAPLDTDDVKEEDVITAPAHTEETSEQLPRGKSMGLFGVPKESDVEKAIRQEGRIRERQEAIHGMREEIEGDSTLRPGARIVSAIRGLNLLEDITGEELLNVLGLDAENTTVKRYTDMAAIALEKVSSRPLKPRRSVVAHRIAGVIRGVHDAALIKRAQAAIDQAVSLQQR